METENLLIEVACEENNGNGPDAEMPEKLSNEEIHAKEVTNGKNNGNHDPGKTKFNHSLKHSEVNFISLTSFLKE